MRRQGFGNNGPKGSTTLLFSDTFSKTAVTNFKKSISVFNYFLYKSFLHTNVLNGNLLFCFSRLFCKIVFV